jgi:hypothetical protein
MEVNNRLYWRGGGNGGIDPPPPARELVVTKEESLPHHENNMGCSTRTTKQCAARQGTVTTQDRNQGPGPGRAPPQAAPCAAAACNQLLPPQEAEGRSSRGSQGQRQCHEHPSHRTTWGLTMRDPPGTQSHRKELDTVGQEMGCHAPTSQSSQSPVQAIRTTGALSNVSKKRQKDAALLEREKAVKVMQRCTNVLVTWEARRRRRRTAAQRTRQVRGQHEYGEPFARTTQLPGQRERSEVCHSSEGTTRRLPKPLSSAVTCASTTCCPTYPTTPSQAHACTLAIHTPRLAHLTLPPRCHPRRYVSTVQQVPTLGTQRWCPSCTQCKHLQRCPSGWKLLMSIEGLFSIGHSKQSKPCSHRLRSQQSQASPTQKQTLGNGRNIWHDLIKQNPDCSSKPAATTCIRQAKAGSATSATPTCLRNAVARTSTEGSKSCEPRDPARDAHGAR